jgi:PAT family beta-lactamase induction signal transducer AmpG
MAEERTDRVEPRGPSHPTVWVSSTYFAEGFPYALVINVADVLFQSMGASLKAIGLTALFHLPWNLKFLWAPTLDRYATKRAFLIGTEVVILAVILVLALLGQASTLALLSLVFIALALVSATHDIAIDGYYMEELDDKLRAKYVGFRAATYRGAVLLATGPLIVVVGDFGWRLAWLFAAAIMAILLAYHSFFLPHTERRQAPLATWLTPKRKRIAVVVACILGAVVALQWATGVLSRLRAVVGAIEPIPILGEMSLEAWIAAILLLVVVVTIASLGRLRRTLERRNSPYARAFGDLLAQPQMGRALGFIVLFRFGESFLMKMRQPFLLDDGPCHLTTQEFGWINGTVGMLATLAGTMLGGWLISRHGLRRWVWPLMLAQNVPNLLYWWAASHADPSALGVVGIGAVVVGEDFGAGLGTAVLLVYIMRCVDPRHKATHMAVLTAIMSLGFTLAGVASGFLADALGFETYFLLTFVATMPSMLLIPFVPHLEDPAEAGPLGERPNPGA